MAKGSSNPNLACKHGLANQIWCVYKWKLNLSVCWQSGATSNQWCWPSGGWDWNSYKSPWEQVGSHVWSTILRYLNRRNWNTAELFLLLKLSTFWEHCGTFLNQCVEGCKMTRNTCPATIFHCPKPLHRVNRQLSPDHQGPRPPARNAWFSTLSSLTCQP